MSSEIEFLEHAKESCLKANVNYQGLEFTIKSKYESWVSAKWKDGNDKKIKKIALNESTTLALSTMGINKINTAKYKIVLPYP